MSLLLKVTFGIIDFFGEAFKAVVICRIYLIINIEEWNIFQIIKFKQ
jgi:hypothetical protein